MKNVLILSCNTGEGHNSCARALKECFEGHGCTCEVADSLLFISEKASDFICKWHVRMYRRLPRIFKTGYKEVETHQSPFRRDTLIYEYLTSGSERLFDYVSARGFDAVVCTHIFAALALSDMLEKHPMPLVTAFVGTDYTCSPGTADSSLQYYFIPSPSLTEEFTMCGVDPARIVPSGLPARREFYVRGDAASAKRAVGVAPEHGHILLMCGSMGCGPITELTKELAARMTDAEELTVICGTNDKLFDKLGAEFAPAKNVHIKARVEDMPLYMRASEVYMTKPGGLSTTESAAMGLPMVLIDAVAGCEEHNLAYFTSLGGAVTADEPAELAEAALRLLRDESARREMSRALKQSDDITPAERIYDVMNG